MSAKQSNAYTVATLKGFLRTRGLQTTGSKAELIARLNELGPTIWTTVEQEFVAAKESVIEVHEEEDFEDGVVESPQIFGAAGRTVEEGNNSAAMRREIELLRRERDVLERELRLEKEERALRRGASTNTSDIN